jgi:hypothetical protein
VDVRTPIKESNFINEIIGSLYADKGYISKEITQMLFNDDLHLVNGIKSNMKTYL